MTLQLERPVTGYEFTDDEAKVYIAPGLPGSLVSLRARYENFIGGTWVAPRSGKYTFNLSPATAQPNL